MSSRNKPPLKEVPDTVFDKTTKKHYKKGRFLGKGGFARCYELVDESADIVYAGKVVAKALLIKKHQKDKVAQECSIHRTLSHPHVVKMEGCFEDDENVYILLELCSRRSLMELHKRRRAVTEPEARYFVYQIVQACEYLHENKIIHRDLKLGNLFLNSEMQVKIGDFGLATTLDYDGERKKTLCGTPNYIAPEMLEKKGHSFEVDIWAIGCILYTLLVGKPPFETETLKETYRRIQTNQYLIPSKVGKNASSLIMALLAADPSRRPRVQEILKHPFFTEGFLPARLPTSCLTMAPKFNMQAVSGGQMADDSVVLMSPKIVVNNLPSKPQSADVVKKQDAASVLVTEKPGNQENVPPDFYLSELCRQLNHLLETKIEYNDRDAVEIQDPASSPIYWITKWVDYSDKYGLGYTLCDGSMAVYFNDGTKLIADASEKNLEFVDQSNSEFYYMSDRIPDSLRKKMKLLAYFRAFMMEKLVNAGRGIPVREGDEVARLPCLNTWYRTSSAILLHLTNGTIQINFFHDHSKLILCPLMGAVTYVDEKDEAQTYRFVSMERYGCPNELRARLNYAKSMVEKMKARSTQFSHPPA